MMTSEPSNLFVWIWLPRLTEPVVCGRLDDDNGRISFTYARSYRENHDAVPIFGPELPLIAGRQFAASGIRLPLCIDDAMPDSWGRRVINHRLGAPTGEFSELTYLLASGSDRAGALDFQLSATEYEARSAEQANLDDLANASRVMETGEPLNAALEEALFHGTSIGGARPKALLADGERRFIAKFSSPTDSYPVVQGDYVAIELARRVGLNAASVEIARAAGRYALLVERFDRDGGCRKRVVSSLTVLGLTAYPERRYATYVDFAHKIREFGSNPSETLNELFARISFNILCGNTDDHGRNHACFVDTAGLELTPAYDLCPQARTGRDGYQAMAYAGDGGRVARVSGLIAASHGYLLDQVEAQNLVDKQVAVIREQWDEVCDIAELTGAQRSAFLGRQFLNPGAFD